MDFRNKIARIGVLTLMMMVSLQSCRKEIVHVPGVTTSNGEEDDTTATTDPPESWVKITTQSGLDLFSIETFNNQVYIGGYFEIVDDSIETFAKLNSQNEIVQAVSGAWIGGVSDFEVIGSDLYVSGSFSHFNTTPLLSAYSFFKMDATETITEIEITTNSWDNVRDITDFNGGIVVSGYFSPDTDNSLVTENVDFVQNGTPVGLANVAPQVYETVVHDGELYIVGNDILLQKWTGTSWITIPYNDPYWQDEVFAIESFQSELYILGKFQNGVLLKKMNASGTWSSITEIASIGTPTFNNSVKVVDGKLYVLGSGFELGGAQASNVISFDGTSWENVGTMNTEARDITSNGTKLYLATSDGIYEINK